MPARAATATLTPQRLGRVRSLILSWYDEHGSDFPWRSAGDPYLALVAAVCSQQTQMSRVLPLYERWVRAFPTIAGAAAATRARALRVWGGAGYPRRALYLRDAARICVREHGGALPRDHEALLALPGVGPFTAAIVRCFGFHEDAVAIDTNVVRVVGRLVLGELQPAHAPPAAIAQAAGRLLRPGTAARWNPALMEYGATVCTPRPRCGQCVVARLCAARPRFAAGETAAPMRAQPRFEGSDRQLRGRILRRLRDRRGALRRRALVDGLAAGGPAERARVRTLLDALCAEGLAWSRGGWCGLGDGPGAGRPERTAPSATLAHRAAPSEE